MVLYCALHPKARNLWSSLCMSYITQISFKFSPSLKFSFPSTKFYHRISLITIRFFKFVPCIFHKLALNLFSYFPIIVLKPRSNIPHVFLKFSIKPSSNFFLIFLLFFTIFARSDLEFYFFRQIRFKFFFKFSKFYPIMPFHFAQLNLPQIFFLIKIPSTSQTI